MSGYTKRMILNGIRKFARTRGRTATSLAKAAWFIDKTARFYIKQYEGRVNGFDANGEAWMVRQLASLGRLRTVFDVGANWGEWSVLVSSHSPATEVHAFEIAPQTFERLSQRTDSQDNIYPRNFGLAEADGSQEIDHFEDHDTLSTLILDSPLQRGDGNRVKVRVRSGDTYCQEHRIEHIDFLKIDVEGAEHLVLKGFDRMLRSGRIDVVQFEYGLASISTHFLLWDYYRFFADRGFLLGRLTPWGIAFKEYRPTDEDFQGPNYVAVRRSKRELVASLNRPGNSRDSVT